MTTWVIDVDWAIKGILTFTLAGWIFVIKYFGGKYITTQEEISKQLQDINTRLTVLERINTILEERADLKEDR